MNTKIKIERPSKFSKGLNLWRATKNDYFKELKKATPTKNKIELSEIPNQIDKILRKLKSDLLRK